MNDREIYELFESPTAQGNNWGFRGGLTDVQNQPLCTVRLPPWMARRFTVTTLQMQYTKGTLVSGAGDPVYGQFAGETSPNNQVGTCEGGLQNLKPFQMTLNWGNGGVQETAYLDYQFAGQTFTFFASQFQLSMGTLDSATVDILSALGLPPALGAFAVVGGMDKELGVGPTYTTKQFSMGLEDGVGQTVYVPIPPRARAYRVISQNGFLNGNPGGFAEAGLLARQITGQPLAFIPVVISDDWRGDAQNSLGEGLGALQGGDFQLFNSAGAIYYAGQSARVLKNNVYNLQPQASGLLLQATSNPPDDTDDLLWTVQFSLDLG